MRNQKRIYYIEAEITYIDTLLKTRGGGVIVVNQVDSDKEDLVQDFVPVVASFCDKIYGQRKRKTEKLLNELDKDTK